jgi:quinoprotein glucose dehydrogenase
MLHFVLSGAARTCHASPFLLAVILGLQLAHLALAVPDDPSPSDATETDMPDWSIEVFSDQVKNATALCVDDQGRIYVTETYRWRVGIEDNRDHTYWIMDDLACDTVEDRAKLYQKWQDRFDADYFTRFSDRVVRLVDDDHDGQADSLNEFAADFDDAVDGPAIGLLAGHDSIYLTCVPNLWRLQDRDQDGVAEHREVLASGFGVKNSLSGHDLHGLAWGPDGKLYFSMGDRGFHVTTKEGRVLRDPNAGAVFRCNPDGSELELFYHQLRNPQELAFNEYGDLFTVDNNCDQGDAARISYLLEGGSSGWHLGTQAQTTYSAQIQDGGMQQAPHWLTEGLWKLRFDEQPTHILPPVGHLTNGPSGLAFHSGVGFRRRYQNHFLVCDYRGAPNQCFLYSFQVRRNDAGYEVVAPHVVRTGIPMTDVEVGYDGKLYVSDFGGGWRRSDQGNVYALLDRSKIESADVRYLTELFREGFSERSSGELRELLAHRDFRVRLRSQYELVRRGADEMEGLLEIAKSGKTPFARYHAIWGLGQLNATEAIVSLADDPELEIRAQVARTLGNIAAPECVPVLLELLECRSARARTFAAVSLAKIGDVSAVEPILRLIENNADLDAFERHAGVFALSKLASRQQLTSLATHPHAAVRRAAILALRRNRDANVAVFLADHSPQLVHEAIRAINDETLSDGFPPLADFVRAQLLDGSLVQDPPSEPIYRRMVNACFRAGRVQDAQTLAELAANDRLPDAYRQLTLRALRHFDAPPPIDATLGLYLPLPQRTTAEYRQAVAAPLQTVAESASGDLAAAAIETLGHFGLSLDPAALLRHITDAEQPTSVRRISLEQLFAIARPEQQSLLESLLEDPAAEMRRTAAKALVRQAPAATARVAQSLIDRNTTDDYRTAFGILAESTDTAAAQLLVRQLDRIPSEQLMSDVKLDVYEAAERNSDASVQAKRQELDAWLASRKQTAFEFTQDGGDAERGRAVFQNQGVCMKCHQGDRGGGDAGPSLADIGKKRRSHEILQSILEPNAIVVDGYGTVTVYRDDGTMISGTPIEETEDTLTLRTALGETQSLPKSAIDEKSPVTSPMPQQAQNLNRQELRDLIAYLMQLQATP